MGNTAGIDVMGDGTIVPFSGGVMRQPLEPKSGESPYDAIRRVL
jgi:hypothetical protein